MIQKIVVMRVKHVMMDFVTHVTVVVDIVRKVPIVVMICYVMMGSVKVVNHLMGFVKPVQTVVIVRYMMKAYAKVVKAKMGSVKIPPIAVLTIPIAITVPVGNVTNKGMIVLKIPIVVDLCCNGGECTTFCLDRKLQLQPEFLS